MHGPGLGSYGRERHVKLWPLGQGCFVVGKPDTIKSLVLASEGLFENRFEGWGCKAPRDLKGDTVDTANCFLVKSWNLPQHDDGLVFAGIT